MPRPVWAPFMAVLPGFELMSDVVAKEFALHGGWWRMALAAVPVVVGTISWPLMLRAGWIWAGVGLLFAVGLVVIGAVFYAEPAVGRHWAGLWLGVAAAYLLAGEWRMAGISLAAIFVIS